MCPIDPSPHGGEILHELHERRFPNAEPRGESAASRYALSEAVDAIDEPDIEHRPALPEHPRQMAVDVEDEEADPVVDSGPGIADGVGGRGPSA